MRPIGIVTDRDLAVRVDAHGETAQDVTAGDVMTEDPVIVERSAGVLEVTNAMPEHSIRRLPVVDDSGTLAGIVTLDDVLALLSTELSDLGDVVQAESPAY